MAKKLTKKDTTARGRNKSGPGPGKPVFEPKKGTPKNNRLVTGLIIAFLGFACYSNTLHHDYVLDDYSLIKENFQTKKGTAALKEIFTSSYRSGYFMPDHELYRPLSKAMFAIEWQIAPDKPSLSHWINVLLYGFTGFLLFYVLTLYMPDHFWISAIASLLFIAHPIHTEVVANIKSRDEILGFLFFLFTAFCLFHYLRKNNPGWLFLSAISFFLGLLSKESTITFLAVIPLMLYYFTPTSLKRQGLIFSLLAITSSIFFIIHMKILGSGPVINPSIMDNLLVGAHNKMLQLTTAVSILGLYLKLLIFPHPLVSDYSFNQIPLAGFTDWHFILSFLIYAAVGIYAILNFRKKDLISFGIIYFFITVSIVSNIVTLIGTSFGERLMYAPSLGFCLIAAALIAKVFKLDEQKSGSIRSFIRNNGNLSGVLLVILVLYFGKTYSRNKAWESNYSLHSSDVLESPNSARAHYYYGNIITQDEFLEKIKDPVEKQATLDTALKEMRRTIRIYPQYADAFHKIGKIYLVEKQLDSAAFYYKKALGLNPGNSIYLNNYGTVLFNTGHLEEALVQFQLSLKSNPSQSDAYNNIGSVYGTMGQQLTAQHRLEEARKSYESAIYNFKKCVEMAPDYASGYYMLAMTYRNIGDQASADYYSNFAKRLNPKLK